MLGFFSSSAISVLCDGFATFLHNGGRMRLVINDILTEDDKTAIEVGKSESLIPTFDLNNIEQIIETLSERDKHFFECLSWLIRNNRIEIKVVAPVSGNGIAHTKCGLFSDGTNKVAFDGSVNFSRTALLENKESLTASCSWDGTTEVAKIDDIESEFLITFMGQDTSVRYLEVEDVRTKITSTFQDKELTELLQDEYRLIQHRVSEQIPSTVKQSLEKAKRKVAAIIEKENGKLNLGNSMEEPQFPFPTGPRKYQNEAFNNWKNNKQKGLFAMATGTGKTITSLNCLLEIYKKSGYYKAIILVPTITLVEQWEKECRKFRFNSLYKVCSKYPKWRAEIDNLKLTEQIADPDTPVSYIIISTYASFAKDDVFLDLNEFPYKQVLLIADEAHNMGSGRILKRLNNIVYLRRIGLSATPERQYDEGVNDKLKAFFGVTDKYTFEYSMKEAIEKGVLCRYEYYPHVVRLVDEEMSEYMEISLKLAKLFNYNASSFPEGEEIVKTLLLKRKCIIHKAVNKKAVFKDILEKRYSQKGNLRYTLVYVPEGKGTDLLSDADVFDTFDVIESDEECGNLIDDYTKIVRDVDRQVTVKQFVSGSMDRDEILSDFASGKLDVLTSMKCLDEGVDVPRSEMAVFCASTGNPRQFIQRRGRILRTHPDKHMAVIHDLVVVPEVNSASDSYTMEKKLLEGELKRVRNFSLLSENVGDTIKELDNILHYYNLSLFE